MIAMLLAIGAGACVLLGSQRPHRRAVGPSPLRTPPRMGRGGHQSQRRWMFRLPLIVGAATAAWLTYPVLALVGIVVVLGIPRWQRRVARAKQEGSKRAALPGTIDLLAVVLGSGGTVSQAVAVLADRADSAVRPSFQCLLQERSSGQSLAVVLHRAPEQFGETYRPLFRALVATERDGAPVTTLLIRLAEEADLSRRRAAEARAKRLSVQLLFPLVACFLPAVIIGAVIPLVVVAAGSFLP